MEEEEVEETKPGGSAVYMVEPRGPFLPPWKPFLPFGSGVVNHGARWVGPETEERRSVWGLSGNHLFRYRRSPAPDRDSFNRVKRDSGSHSELVVVTLTLRLSDVANWSVESSKRVKQRKRRLLVRWSGFISRPTCDTVKLREVPKAECY